MLLTDLIKPLALFKHIVVGLQNRIAKEDKCFCINCRSCPSNGWSVIISRELVGPPIDDQALQILATPHNDYRNIIGELEIKFTIRTTYESKVMVRGQGVSGVIHYKTNGNSLKA